jgi:AraC-like DNA-binding protein
MSDYLEVGTFLSSGKSTGDEPEREFLGIASAEPQAHLPLDVKIAGWSQWQPGEGVERQAASTFSIELVLEGKGHFRVDTARYDVQPGDVFFHHAGRNTVCRADKNGLFKKTFVALWAQKPVLYALLKTFGLATVNHLRLQPATVSRAQELFKQLRETAHQKPAQYTMRLSLLSFELLLLLAAEQRTFEQKAEVPERLARVFAHARQILDHPLTVADLAAVADCTPTHLNRLFTTHLGMHAHEWIEKTKMERAATLLRTRRIPICQICDLVGYEDPFHFSHTFKRVTGMSPSQYRAHCRRVIETSRRAARGRKIS